MGLIIDAVETTGGIQATDWKEQKQQAKAEQTATAKLREKLVGKQGI